MLKDSHTCTFMEMEFVGNWTRVEVLPIRESNGCRRHVLVKGGKLSCGF